MEKRIKRFIFVFIVGISIAVSQTPACDDYYQKFNHYTFHDNGACGNITWDEVQEAADNCIGS